MGKEDYLVKKVEAFKIENGATASRLLEKMEQTAFQGKNLALAARVWEKALREDTTIMMGLSGAMVPAGMRDIVKFAIENKMIDVLVSTGANLFHDAHEALGLYHYQGSANVDDKELLKHKIDRIYDVFASEDEFLEVDAKIRDFSKGVGKSYTTREFLYRLGLYLEKEGKVDTILTKAAQNKFPIFSPALCDSAIGLALAEDLAMTGRHVEIDTIRDVVELTSVVSKANETGVIYLGGGIPKNYIQQTEVAYTHMEDKIKGHKYAIQVTTDNPVFGGLSGCTFDEAQSWGKIAADAEKVMVFCDITIALPLIASAVYERCADMLENRKRPDPGFKWD